MKRKRFAVLGLGHFGLNLCFELMERGAEVLAVDNREERVELVRNRVTHALIADTRDFKALKSMGLEDMDAVVVAIGEDFESSILTTAHLQEIGVPHVVNRVVSPVHEKLLKMMRIEDLVLPEADAAGTLSRRLTMSGVMDILKLTSDYSVIEVKVPKPFVGKTVQEVDLRRKFHVNLVTILRRSQKSKMMTLGDRDEVEVLGVPTQELKFSENDVLVLFGQEKELGAFTEKATN